MGLVVSFKSILPKRKDADKSKGQETDKRQNAKSGASAYGGFKVPASGERSPYKAVAVGAAPPSRPTAEPPAAQPQQATGPVEKVVQPMPAAAATIASQPVPSEAKVGQTQPVDVGPVQATEPQPQPEKGKDAAADDILSLFTEELTENLDLKLLLEGLNDVDVVDLMKESRELMGQMKERWR